MPDYRVVFTRPSGTPICEKIVTCAFAHNAAKVAISDMPDDERREAYKAVAVTAELVEGI